MQIRVEGIVGAKALVRNGWPTHIVSLVSPHLDWPKMGHNHIIMRMNDVPLNQGSNPPQYEQIADILDWTITLERDDKLLVNCHAGQSRSTAMAIGVLIQHGASTDEAFEKIKSLRPFLLPNPLIMSYLDRYLGTTDLESRAQSMRSSNTLEKRRERMLGPNNVDAMADIMARIQKKDD